MPRLGQANDQIYECAFWIKFCIEGMCSFCWLSLWMKLGHLRMLDLYSLRKQTYCLKCPDWSSFMGTGRNITVCRTNYLFISIGLVSSRMLVFKCLQRWRKKLWSCFVMINNLLGRNVELRVLVPLSSFTKDSGASFHKVRQISSAASVILWPCLAVFQLQDFMELGIPSSRNLWIWSYGYTHTWMVFFIF